MQCVLNGGGRFLANTPNPQRREPLPRVRHLPPSVPGAATEERRFVGTASAGWDSYPLHIQLVHLVTVRSRSGPTAPAGAGGGLLHYARLAREWGRQGHIVTVVTNVPGMFDDRSSRVVALGGVSPTGARPDGGDLVAPLRAVVRALVDTTPLDNPLPSPSGATPGPSVVISASPNLSDILLARRLSRAARLPVVVAFHHLTPPPWWHPDRRGGLVRCVLAWFLSQAGLFVTKVLGYIPSIDQVRILSESGWRFPPPVLPDEAFLEAYPRVQSSPETNRSIDASFVSRLSPAKGLFDLLAIWGEVHCRLPDSRLVIGGDFESAAVERRFRAALGKAKLGDSVVLRGPLSDGEKQDLLSNSKLFVFPSYEEGWSLSVMEAAAYGCVPVVYDMPAYDYLGPVVPRGRPGDVRGLAKLVIDLLSNPQERNELAMNLARIPPSFTAEGVAHNQIAVFRTLTCQGTNR